MFTQTIRRNFNATNLQHVLRFLLNLTQRQGKEQTLHVSDALFERWWRTPRVPKLPVCPKNLLI